MANPTPETPVAATPPADGAVDESKAEKAPAASSGGGLKAWLPLLVTLVTMPALAYVTTAFFLVPGLQKKLAAADSAAAPQTESKPASKPSTAATDKNKEVVPGSSAQKDKTIKTTSSGKTIVPLSKILVNVAGSMGSRYLLANLTLAGGRKDFAETVQDNEAQLIDLAAGVLSAKTISDLEKPEARTVIRAELLTVFNNALGPGTVEQVYFTDFAVQ